jgi:penicillin-binding protein-related factor A (putative recombinase)
MDPTNQIAWDIKDTKARTNLLLCTKDNQLVHVKSVKTSKEISYQIKINF